MYLRGWKGNGRGLRSGRNVLVRLKPYKTISEPSVTGGPCIRIHSLVAEWLPSKEPARVRFPLDALVNIRSPIPLDGC